MATQTNLSIDPRRLWDSIQDTARFGGTPKGGVRRLACTGEDKLVRDWFRAECEAIGCSVAIDRCGNMFATFPGRNPALPPIATGSHLDTQPTGGKYDGILGVLAGLEVIRTLAETGYQTNAPLMVVNWTNEEGSRFPPAMQCSGVYAGAFALDDALATPDREGVTLGQALDLIGYAGDEPIRADRFQAMFELHIEQGPILEAEQMTIGAVLGVQGIRWHEVTLYGQDAHTGATPMNLRRDALCGMAAVVTALQDIGRQHAPGVASVGLVENRPNSRNVVPGEVFFTVDLRHPDEAMLDKMEAAFLARLAAAAQANSLEVAQRRIWESPAVAFDPIMIACVKAGAEKAGLATRDMISGAGHDAAYIAALVPTTMIFVPCEKGISHNESEAATLEDCAAGAQVLLNAILEYDTRLS
ncbi:MAG: M20 family metallo-hydrolase [Novosphingobium sp.]|uniref:M20 family metallo-hydrolase n=1 Tax=Novosphingobium sp. TaxID=1874826 RepID=UPI0030185987